MPVQWDDFEPVTAPTPKVNWDDFEPLGTGGYEVAPTEAAPPMVQNSPVKVGEAQPQYPPGTSFLSEGKPDTLLERVRQNLSPLLGPTEEQRSRDAIKNPTTGKWEYKPAGGLIEQKGLLPGLGEALSTTPEAMKPGRVDPASPQFQAFLTGALGRPPSAAETAITAGTLNAAGGFAEFFESPAGAATLASGAAPSWLQRVVKLYFAQQMARQVPEAASRLGTSSVTGTGAENVENALNLAGDIGFPADLVKSSLKPQTVTPLSQPMPEPTEPVMGSDLNMPRTVYPPARPKRNQPVVVPETPAESERGLSAVEEVRQKNARTIRAVKNVFPAVQMNNEQARALLRLAFPEGVVEPAAENRPIADQMLPTPTPEVSNASEEQKAAEVHGDVQPQPEQGEGQVPAEESGGGVQPPAEGAQSDVSLKQPEPENTFEGPTESTVPTVPTTGSPSREEIGTGRPSTLSPPAGAWPKFLTAYWEASQTKPKSEAGTAFTPERLKLAGSTPEQAQQIIADAVKRGVPEEFILDRSKYTATKLALRDIEEEPGTTENKPAANAPKPESDLNAAVDELVPHIKNGSLTKQIAHDVLAKVYGGTMAEGKFDQKHLTDVVETAVNRMIATDPVYSPNQTAQGAIERVKLLKAMVDNLPTQTVRSVEQDKLQQFSTPPPLAYVANWVAKLDAEDVVLEPSAGTGGLAAFAKNVGAKVIGNEISPRRAELLKLSNATDFQRGHNAEHLNALLKPEIAAGDLPQPTAVVMNPPFSHGAVSGVKSTLVGAQHIEEALKVLPAGGRVVGIVGEGMGMDKPKFRTWWNRMSREYNVRANIGVAGEEYRKYGTTFGNQMVVIDKTGPTPAGGTVTGHVSRIEDLIPLLSKVRDDRPGIEPTTVEPGGETPVAPGGGVGRPEAAEPVQPGAPGAGGERGAGGPVEPGGENPERVDPERGQPSGGDAGTGQRDVGGVRPESPHPGGGTGGGRGAERRLAGLTGLSVQKIEQGQRELNEHGVFSEYFPQKVKIEGAKAHPTPLVEPTAMAAVDPVDPNYSPKLPKELIESGALSDAQLENVVYAGQAHDQVLPDGKRLGYFIGDGTGVGKGRQIAAIILDNFNRGRKKAVWVSKSSGLIRDAGRDMKDIGMDPALLLDMKKAKGKGILGAKEGVAFVPYSSLSTDNPGVNEDSVKAGEPKLNPAKPDKQGRMHALESWLGKNFDGLIVLDEAHLAGNAVRVKGPRGFKDPSQRGLTIVDLQKLFPKARFVYASATGATDVTNLSYADRLGIWGPGTPFSSKNAFFEQVQAGGLSAMEIVARDLKSMGRYMARTLSFEGVGRRQLVHKLSPEQTQLYDNLASSWQYVLGHRDETMARTQAARDPRALSAANAAFYGAQQRFYNQLLTAMQMPSVIEDMRKELAKGHSAVLQVVNTNEETLKRELASKGAEATSDEDTNYLETLDLSPRDILLQYINESYPTALYEQYMDPEGNIRFRQVKDAKGNPVSDPQAEARKQELMDKMALIKAPQNPLEMLMETFGAENVAEVTGRSTRIVNKLQPDGSRKLTRENNRGEAQRKVESQEFQDGKRRILVFSDAGGTGFSYHASRKATNQQRRIHYLIQAGWRADTAMQGFGRTHRSDQANAPEYVLASTDIKGHQRFMSTIARRLAELGALTGGERKSAGGELFNEDNNLETNYAEDAVTRLFRDLYAKNAPGLDFNEISKKLGFTRTLFDEQSGQMRTVNTLIDPKTGGLNVTKIPTIQRFLNRLLSLQVDPQNQLFDAFMERLRGGIDAAKQAGSYDPGLQTLKAQSIRKIGDEVVYQHPTSTAKTRLVEIEHDQPERLRQFDDIKSVGRPDEPVRFVQAVKTGKIFALKEGSNATLENGAVVERYRRLGVNGRVHDLVPKHEITTQAIYGQEPNYRDVSDPAAARQLWEAELAKTPTSKTYRDTYLTGAFLPIWDRIKMPDPKIWRVTTDKKETFLGAHVPSMMVESLRQRLGAGAGAADTPQSVFRDVLDHGKSVELANGWFIRRSRVAGENRIEVTGPGYDNRQEFTDHIGGFEERIDWKPRFFIPTDEVAGAEAMKKLLAKSPPLKRQTTTIVEPPLGSLPGERVPGKEPGMGFATAVEFSTPTMEDMISGKLAPKRERPAQPAATPAQSQTINGWHAGLNDALEKFKGVMGSIAGKSAPRTTLKGRDLGESLVRWASSRIAARPSAELFAADVISQSGIDPVKLGAALTEDNLRSVRQSFEEAGDAEKAGKVRSLVGEQGFPFAKETDYQDFLNDPVVQETLERHKDLWQTVIDPQYREAMRIEPDVELPSRGLQTGARINLRAIVEGESPTDFVRTARTGNLLGTLRKKSPFGVQAKGTGDGYWLNYYDLMENTFGRQLEIANKNAFEKKLVEAGQGLIEKPGQRVIIDGQSATEFPLKRQRAVIVREGGETRSRSQNQSLYVNSRLASEYRFAANVDAKSRLPFFTPLARMLNTLAISSGTDATTHLVNQFSLLATVPGTSGRPLLQEAMLSALPGRPDAVLALGRAVLHGMKDNRAQLAALAEIGALREETPGRGVTKVPPFSWAQHAIQYMDKGVRLVLDDAYSQLVKQGLVENSQTARREFINQLGQYNRRLQSRLVRQFRDTGLGPFVTAGTTFNTMGVRAVTFSPGVKATTMPAAIALRGAMMAKLLGAAATVGLLNYITTGQMAGRKGTPLGDVDLGINDKSGRMLHIPVLSLFGPARGLRVTGARGLIQSKMLGLSNADALDTAWRDAFNSWTSPFAGPLVRAGVTAATGYPAAIGVGRQSAVVPPGENQVLENFKTALVQASPVAAGIAKANTPGGTAMDAVASQLPRLLPQAGRTEAMMRDYPGVVRRAQASAFIEDVIGRARRMSPDDRATFLLKQVNRLEDLRDRQAAMKQFKYRKVI